MIDIAKIQFENSIKREKQTVIDSQGDTHFVLFRKNDNKNSANDYLTIFHYPDSGINIGDLLVYQDCTLLVLNCETIENNSYKRSDLIRCNQVINIGIEETKKDEYGDMQTFFVPQYENVPCFVDNMIVNLKQTAVGTLDKTVYCLCLSAVYKVSTAMLVQMKSFEYNKATKKAVIVDKLYDIQSVDTSNVIFENGETRGILYIQILPEL